MGRQQNNVLILKKHDGLRELSDYFIGMCFLLDELEVLLFNKTCNVCLIMCICSQVAYNHDTIVYTLCSVSAVGNQCCTRRRLCLECR